MPGIAPRAVGKTSRRLAADARLATAFLPIGHGVAVSVRLGGSPDVEDCA